MPDLGVWGVLLNRLGAIKKAVLLGQQDGGALVGWPWGRLYWS